MIPGRTKGKRLRYARGDTSIDEIVAEYRRRYGKKGVSRGSLSRWEHDDGWPSLEILKGLTNVLGIALADVDLEAADRIAELFPDGTQNGSSAENPRSVRVNTNRRVLATTATQAA